MHDKEFNNRHYTTHETLFGVLTGPLLRRLLYYGIAAVVIAAGMTIDTVVKAKQHKKAVAQAVWNAKYQIMTRRLIAELDAIKETIGVADARANELEQSWNHQDNSRPRGRTK